MARPLRLEFPGALYHVTSRGNARADIFVDDKDRKTFLGVLGDVVERCRWICHAYCLMDNHYHLVIETPEGNLSLGMRQLNGVYTQRFNRRHGRGGHLLQGRFKAIVVERESYLLELCRYVVLNPVRAGMVKDIRRYPWSSYSSTAGAVVAPSWLSWEWLLSQFGSQRGVARRRYEAFVAEGRGHPSPWPHLKGQVLLGSEAFVERVRPLVESKSNLKEIPRAQRLAHRPSLWELFPAGLQGDKLMRDQAITRACREYGYTLAAVARAAGLHYSTVSKVLKAER
jgi:putative transposase